MTGIGSGLSGQVGWSAESVYGTYVAPVKFAKYNSETLDRTYTRVQGTGIQPGVFGEIGQHFVEPVNDGGGNIVMDIQSKGLGVLFQALMGTTVTPVQQGGSAAYLQTHTLADPIGKFISLQAGVPQRNGTVTPKTLTGAKVTDLDLACTTVGLLTGTFMFDAKSYTASGQSLAAASYSATNVFHGGQLAVRLGTYGSEAAVSGVKGMTAKISRPMESAGYFAGNAGQKVEPVLNAVAAITGTLDVNFLLLADFHDRIVNNTSASIVFEWTGPLIASTYYETFRLTLPGVTFEGIAPGVASRDVVHFTPSFTWRYDGTNLPKIEYMSTDTTL